MIFVQQDLVTLLAVVVALVVGITCHEFSHALVADFLGDHRPRAMGRVSLNPLRHIDPLGAIFFLAAGFGWGRPVMVNAAPSVAASRGAPVHVRGSDCRSGRPR